MIGVLVLPAGKGIEGLGGKRGEGGGKKEKERYKIEK